MHTKKDGVIIEGTNIPESVPGTVIPKIHVKSMTPRRDITLWQVWASDESLAHCLDPGPCCSNWDMHVWEEGESPLLGPATFLLISIQCHHLGFRGHGGNLRNGSLSPFRTCCCRVWQSMEWACCILNYCVNGPPYLCAVHTFYIHAIVSCTYYLLSGK